ncbi:MAG TPA: hypothetical protein VFN21_05485, partial [Acidimicrobiales bacterium]|nr:hypothetical protein [Acidimicrobiales bacterium]
LARSLRAFVECQIEFAEHGYIVIQPVGPHFGGKPLVWTDDFVDRFVKVCIDHGICPALHLGTDEWLKRPEAASFTID